MPKRGRRVWRYNVFTFAGVDSSHSRFDGIFFPHGICRPAPLCSRRCLNSSLTLHPAKVHQVRHWRWDNWFFFFFQKGELCQTCTYSLFRDRTFLRVKQPQIWKYTKRKEKKRWTLRYRNNMEMHICHIFGDKGLFNECAMIDSYQGQATGGNGLFWLWWVATCYGLGWRGMARSRSQQICHSFKRKNMYFFFFLIRRFVQNRRLTWFPKS